MTISFKKIALIVLAVVFIGSIAFVANAQSAPLDLAKATLKLEAKSTQYRLKSAGERVKPQMKREYEIVTTVEQTEVVTLEQVNAKITSLQAQKTSIENQISRLQTVKAELESVK